MKKFTVNVIGTAAVALAALGLAAPAAADITAIQPAQTGPGYVLDMPDDDTYVYDFGVLGNRGPRHGVARPGFGGGTDRPVFGPSAEGRN
jgi:hypothetical protein